MAAWGHEHHDHSLATGVVKERMDTMAEMGKRMKAISRRVRSGETLAKVSEDAAFIRDTATKLIPLFPAGSTQPPTEAAFAIWRNFDDFAGKAKVFEREAAKLATPVEKVHYTGLDLTALRWTLPPAGSGEVP
jgi:cytochrome c556